MVTAASAHHETGSRWQSALVQITINGCLAVVDPGHEQVLARQLEYAEICFDVTGSHRLLHRRRVRHVYERTHGGQLVVPVGCVPRVHQHLSQHGLDVRIVDRRHLDRGCLRVVEDRAPQADMSFPGITDTIRRHTEGILAAPRGQRRNVLIGTLCHLLPAARTFIACSTQSRCREIADALGPFVGGDVQAVHGGDWGSACRIVCGTYTSFDTSDPADWDMLVFEDAIEALGRKTHEKRGRYGDHRVYAFIDPQMPLSAKDRLLLEVLAGPVIYRVPTRSRRAPTTIEVVFANVPLCYRQPAKDPRRQKEDLWADQQRNTVIGRVATAFAQRDPAPLWEAGIMLDYADPFSRWDHTLTVAVLVESARHADDLAKSLPGWQVLHSRPATDGSTADASGGWADWVLPPRSIVTITRAAKMKTFAPDVIVMAAGGSHPLLPRGLVRRAKPVLIVDFADDGHHVAIKDREQRVRAYTELGCQIASQPGYRT
jgi:hypothetical protein